MPYCQPGTKDGALTKTITSRRQRQKPPSATVYTVNYANQTLGVHNRSSLVKVPIDPFTKWRTQAPYRVFAAQVKGRAYDYTVNTSATTTWRYWGDDSDRAGAYGPPSGLEYYLTILSGGIRIPDVSQNMKNQTITEALLKMQDNKMQIMVSLAEAAKTIAFVSSIVGRIARSWKLFLQGRWAQAIRVLTGAKPAKGSTDTASGAWLEYQYGLIPLIADVHGGFALAGRGLRESGSHVTGHRVIERQQKPPDKPLNKAFWVASGKFALGCEVQLYAKLDSWIEDALTAMGANNPFIVAWELLPYSFVIDWLLPIGNVLQALTAHLGMHFTGGYMNTKSWCEFTVSCCKDSPYYGTPPQVAYKNVCQKRDVYLDFPWPKLYIKSPFSTSHTISAIALIKALT